MNKLVISKERKEYLKKVKRKNTKKAAKSP